MSASWRRRLDRTSRRCPSIWRSCGRQAAALRWADDAGAEFLGELERRGVLRDTVVSVTSDESLGSAQASSTTQRLLMQSWSFVIVMLPEPARKTVGTMHGHVDIALSIADLIGTA